MSQFDLDIHYIRGEDNVAADALSRPQDAEEIVATVVPHTFNPASTLTHACLAQLDVLTGVSLLEHDRALMMEIVEGYTTDTYCRKLFLLLGSMPNLEEHSSLSFLDQWLVIPNVPSLHAPLFHLAHDAGGHFGADKTYESLHGSFYWPNMLLDS